MWALRTLVLSKHTHEHLRQTPYTPPPVSMACRLGTRVASDRVAVGKLPMVTLPRAAGAAEPQGVVADRPSQVSLLEQADKSPFAHKTLC